MDTPNFDLPVNGTAPDQYATETGLENRINAGFGSIVTQTETAIGALSTATLLRERHGEVEDVDSQYGTNRWVITRRAAFAGSTDYVTGKKYIVQAANTNTGTVMVSIGTEPDRPLLDADGNELLAGEITANRYYMIRCGAANTRNYRLIANTMTEKQRFAITERTGLIQLTNVSGTGTTITGEPFGVVGAVSDVTTGMLFSLVANAANAGRSVTLRIGDNGAHLPVRAVDGTPLRVGALKADRLYVLRRYGPAATDPHYRVVLGVDPVTTSGGGSLPDPVDDFEIAVPGDYPNLQAAFDAALWVRAKTINIVIASGHLLTKGLRSDGAYAGHIRITYAGTGAVKLAAGFVGADNTDVDVSMLSEVYQSANNLFVFNGGVAPTIAALFDMEHKDGNGYAGVNTQSQISPECGVINAGRAGFVQQGGQVYALHSKFGGAGGEGVRCQQGCTGSFQGANIDGSLCIPAIRTLTSQCAFYVSRASSIQFQDGSANNSGGHGIGCHRAWLSATDADVKNATFRGIEASHGCRIIANRIDLSGAGEYAVSIGTGGNALVDVNGANLKGAGIASVYPTEGGHVVSMWGAATNSTPGTWARGTNYVPVISDINGYDSANPISFNLPSYRGLYLANVPSPVDALRGGTTGQVLAKLSGADFDLEWQDASGGGGGVPTSRTITGTGDLTGGGNLTANRTLDLTADAKAKLALAVAAADAATTAAALATKEPLHGFLTFSTATRDLAATDNRVRLRATHATPVLTIRHQADVAYTDHTLVEGSSLNALTITGSASVTVNGTAAGSVVIPPQSDFRIERITANDWIVTGRGVTGLPAVTSLDNGKALTVVSGVWAAATLPASLPAVGAPDNGKVLKVVGGGWAADAAPITGQSLCILPEDYSGTTEAKLNAAIAAAISAGKPLWLGGDYSITSALTTVSLTAGQRLDVRGPGSIIIAADIARPILVEAVLPAATTVTALSLTTYTMDGGSSATECIKLTSASHGCAAGDIVKLLADDAIPGEISTDRRVGEYFRVGAVDGNDVYLAGQPIDSFATGIRLQRFVRDTDFSWIGPRIRHTAGQTWQVNALTLRNLVGATVDAEFHDGYDCGLQPQSCLLGKFRTGIWGFKNKINSQGISAYGVQDCCGWLNEFEVYGAESRHFFTTGTLTTSAGGATYQYGRTVGARITGSVMGSTSAGFDLHSSAYGCVIHDVSVTGGSAGEDGSGVAAQLRGRNGRVVGLTATGTAHGLQFWAQNAEDGQHLSAEGINYTGDGDAVRFGTQAAGVLLKAPRVNGGTYRVKDNLRTFYAARTDKGMILNAEIRPVGSLSGSNALTLASDAEIWLIQPRLDLTDFTGATYDLVSFATDVTNARVVIVAPIIIDPNNKLRSLVNAGNTVGNTGLLIGEPEDIAYSSSRLINGDDFTLEVRTSGGGGTVTADAIISAIQNATEPEDLGAALISAIQSSNPDAFLTTGALVDRMEDAALLTTGTDPIAARIGKAVYDAQGALPAAEILGGMGDLAYRAGGQALLIPAGAAPGDIVTVGAELAAHVRMAGSITPLASIPTPSSFPLVNLNSLIEYASAEAFLAAIKAALATSNHSPSLVSNVLAYDANANPRASISISANMMLHPSCWTALRQIPFLGDAELSIEVTGATDRTINVGTVVGTQALPSDGFVAQDGDGSISLPFTMPAGKVTSWLLGKRRGGVPILRLLGIGAPLANSAPAYLSSATPDTGAAGARSIAAANMPAGMAAGDLLIAISINVNSPTQATFSSGWTVVSGLGGDGMTPGFTVATKTCSGPTDAVSCANATRLHCIAIRKAGSVPVVGTPVFNHSTLYGQTSISWPAITMAQRGIMIGVHAQLSTDTTTEPLRSEFGSPVFGNAGSNNGFYLGITGILEASTAWSAVTTARSGGIGRDLVAAIPVY